MSGTEREAPAVASEKIRSSDGLTDQAAVASASVVDPQRVADSTLSVESSDCIAEEEENKKKKTTTIGESAGGDGNEEELVEAPLPFSMARCLAIVVTLMGASFLNTFSVQSVVIILPTISRDLNISTSREQWVVSAYVLSFGCFLMLWGRVADLYGRRRVFILGSLWVAATTAANPFMPNEIAFDVFRALQGLGAAANVPTAIGMIATIFPPGKAKTYAFSAYSSGAPIGAVLGNILSGVIATYASWKWVFGIAAIMAAIITIAGILILPPSPNMKLVDQSTSSSSPPARKATIDWVGAILITVGLLILLFALTEGNVVGWSTAYIPVLIVVALLLVTAFVFWQHRLEVRLRGGRSNRVPLMKISIFRNREFSAAMLIMAFFWSSFNGYLVYATYFFQNYQALSAIETTLRFIPTGVTGLITIVVVSQLLARVPTYALLLFSCACVSVSSMLFALPIPPHTTYFAYGLWAMILSTFGADTTYPSVALFVSHALPHEDQAMGGAIMNAIGQAGRSIGLAIATATQTAVMASRKGVDVEDAGPVLPWDEPSLAGLRAANWVNFCFGVAAFVVVAVAFRGSGIVGKKGVEEARRKRMARRDGMRDEA